MALEAWKPLLKRLHGEAFLAGGESIKDPRKCSKLHGEKGPNKRQQ